jgi:uncharacterized phiE125 gp8 family phage protein
MDATPYGNPNIESALYQGGRFRFMQRDYLLVNGPACEPVSILEAKGHGRRGLDVTNEDSQWQSYISSARQEVEKDTERRLLWQRMQLVMIGFPYDDIKIEKCPLLSVESITYFDQTNTLQTLNPSLYQVVRGEPARITRAYKQNWPATLYGQPASVIVTFTLGYAVRYTVTGTGTVNTSGYTPTNGDTWRVSNSGGTIPNGLFAGNDYFVVGAAGNTCGLANTPGGSSIAINGGTGTQFLGEVPENIKQAMRLRMALSFADREGADYAACERAYWSTVYGAKWH